MTRAPAAEPASAPTLTRGQCAALLALPLLTALGWAAYTGEMWEDFLITFRHTENFMRGQGLVYHPPERVHGFTSVLNTLLPAPAMLFSERMIVAFHFYLVCSLLVMAGGLASLFRAMRERLGSSPAELWSVSVLLALSVKVAAFSTNGQEGGLLVGFLGLGIAAALRFHERRQWVWFGLAAAGLLYTRPDALIYIVGLAWIAFRMFRSPWKELGPGFLRSALLCALVYSPWLVFAWWYYGSPVPHTVMARSTGHVLINDSALLTLKSMWWQFFGIAAEAFGPLYQPGNWPDLLLVPFTLVGLALPVYWAVPVADAFGRACSAALCLLMIYLSWVGAQSVAFPWYMVPVCLLGILVTARATWTLARGENRFVRQLAFGGFATLLLANAACFGFSLKEMRIQQIEIEDQTRTPVGLWLKEHAKPGEVVYAECLGYVGYFFGGTMADYPGLVSPQVVEIRREHGDDYARVPVFLKPRWIVARPAELNKLFEVEENKASYDVVGKFDAHERLDRYGRFPGESMLRNDAVLYVLRRKDGL
ncbi:MAG TPA: hypothetical protein VM509_13995 [Planctomycetota bacterium]|nr:hypothetical protein [Planctomycetota bacterium]